MGFYNKVVLGNLNTEINVVELNGYKWNFTQLLAHEMIRTCNLTNWDYGNQNQSQTLTIGNGKVMQEYHFKAKARTMHLYSNLKYFKKTKYRFMGDSS